MQLAAKHVQQIEKISSGVSMILGNLNARLHVLQSHRVFISTSPDPDTLTEIVVFVIRHLYQERQQTRLR